VKTEILLPHDTARQRMLFGPHDANIRMLRDHLGVSLVFRRGRLVVEGGDRAVQRTATVVERLLEAIDRGEAFLADEVAVIVEQTREEEERRKDGEAIFTERRRIEPRTPGQSRFVRAIRDHSLVFGLGPAGTGKTYLAVACAVEALRYGDVKRIVLTRPAVEAGERLGFLPGDMREKVDPYLKPIYDALDDMLSRRQLAHYASTGAIEVAPLAFMRGRTLARSFVILDEAQNTTPGQMKMLLTRLGEQARCVVTGDSTQTDLPEGDAGSGLLHAARILPGIPDIARVSLTGEDIVRHPLVRAIVDAYEKDGDQRGAGPK